jgi:hypothetical protein
MSARAEAASGSITEALEHAEAAVGAGRPLSGTGFWKAVDRARRSPRLAEEFADRIAAVDRRSFESQVHLRAPVWLGNVALSAGTGAGVLAIALAPRLPGLARSLVFVGGVGALAVTTHSLTHWIVGRAMGMRFTHYFLGGPPPPRPGLKIDYATYLRVPPKRRALMHASGAVVTKLIPFALIPVAAAQGQPRWLVGLLVAVGAGQIVTDIAFSTKTSDWKRVRRELRAASAYSG